MDKGIKVNKELLINLKKKEVIIPLTKEQITLLKDTKTKGRFYENIEWRFELIPLTKKISFIGKKPKRRK